MIYDASKYASLTRAVSYAYVRTLITIIDEPREFDLVRNSDCNLRRTLSFSRSAEISMKIMAPPRPYFIHAIIYAPTDAIDSAARLPHVPT